MSDAATPAAEPRAPRSALRLLLRSLRPEQWIKNTVVFAALVYAHLLTDARAVAFASVAFAAFCLAAGASYLVNDWLDRERDRHHPERRHRPLASGALDVRFAIAAAVALAVAAIALGAVASAGTAVCVAAYLALTVAYSTVLKTVVILDVMAIAAGFLLRALAGGVAIGVTPSAWLVLCTLLLALFLGFCKRRSELVRQGEAAASSRPILREYTIPLLDQMIAVVTASTVIAYSIYTVSAATVVRAGVVGMEWTIPFVVYGIFRYLYLVYRHGGGADAARALVRDRPLLVNVALWIVVTVALLYR